VNSFFRPILKYFLIFSLVIAMGMSVWLLPRPVKKEESITPPINATDEAGRFIQRASENFFYHEFDQAIENYKKAIVIYEREGKLKTAAKVFESIGDLFKFRRNLKEAETHYKLAMENHRKNQDLIGEARAMNLAGDLYMERGDFLPAGVWYKKGLALIKNDPPHITKALLLENLGHYFWKTEEISEAIARFTESRATFAALENQMGYEHINAVLNILRRGKSQNIPNEGLIYKSSPVPQRKDN
jgi:tetratricopeptide (TPR) repeat protein